MTAWRYLSSVKSPAAKTPRIDVSVESADDLEPAETIDPKNTASYFGQFTKAFGMPLSLANGNPNLLGPNFVKCGDDTTVEKIMVINLSGKVAYGLNTHLITLYIQIQTLYPLNNARKIL